MNTVHEWRAEARRGPDVVPPWTFQANPTPLSVRFPIMRWQTAYRARERGQLHALYLRFMESLKHTNWRDDPRIGRITS